MKVTIVKTGINGEGIGYIDKKPVFVPGALINEVAEIAITDKKQRYMQGKVQRLIKKSPARIKADCPLQHKCGGCALMIAKYQEQLEMKQALLRQTLIKYAQVNPKLIENIRPSQRLYGYRNQCKLPCAMVDGVLTTGMYLPNSNYFQEVSECRIHETGLETIRKEILDVCNRYHLRAYDYHQKKGIRSLIIRGFDSHYQVCIVSGEQPLPAECVEDLMMITGLDSLWQSYHTVKKTADMFGTKMIHLAGEKRLYVQFDGLSLRLSPRSFFQLNTDQAVQLYRTIASLIEDGQDRIVEAYSGIGAISLYIKDKAKEIIGVESIKDAVVNANENAKANQAHHVSFLCADAADKCTYLSKKHKIDTLIVDPPRSGLDDAMLECILRSKIKHVIYVSCNPATLGKNLAYLQERYQIQRIIPFDMFPHTPHVESIVLMSRVDRK